MAILFNRDNAEVNFFASSGALGFDGRGYWWNRLFLSRDVYPPPNLCAVLKTITLKKTRGNGIFPRFKIRPIFREKKLVGFVNALGLPNPGFENFLNRHLKNVDFENRQIAVSIAGTKNEMVAMASRLDAFDLTAIELNVSCPNAGENLKENTKELAKLCRAVTQNTRHDLMLKISYAHDFARLAQEAEGLVRAVSFNSIPWRIAFPNKKSPFARYGGGGVSGKVVRWFYEDMATKIKRFTDMPVIMPVWDYKDIKTNEEMGAGAHSFGSVFIASPRFPAFAIKRHQEENKIKIVPS